MTDSDRVHLTVSEAEAMLPEGDDIHTVIQSGLCMIGADWRRADILAAFEQYGAELSGPRATASGHGLVFFRSANDPVFVATK